MLDSRAIHFFFLLITLNEYCFAMSPPQVYCPPDCDKYITNEGMEICACAGTIQRHPVMHSEATVCQRDGCEARMDGGGEVVCVCVSHTMASNTECARGCLSYVDEDGQLGCDCSKTQEDCRKKSCEWGFECQRLKEECRVFMRGVSCVERWKCIRSSYQPKSESLEVKNIQNGGENNMRHILDTSNDNNNKPTVDCSYQSCRFCQGKVTTQEGKYYCEGCQCLHSSTILQQKRSIDIDTKTTPPSATISIDMESNLTTILPAALPTTETTTVIFLPNTTITDNTILPTSTTTNIPTTVEMIVPTTTTNPPSPPTTIEEIVPTTTTTLPPSPPTTIETIVPTTTTTPLTSTTMADDEDQEEDIDGIVSTFFDE